MASKGDQKELSQATSKRLLNEFLKTSQSDTVKSGHFEVELVKESLQEWNVKIFKVDPDSNLAKDLVNLKGKNGQDHIMLSFTFPDDFPFKPPFVRIISPVLRGGFVTPNGAVCLELLTPQEWSAAYSIESIIVGLAATFVQGKARINFDANPRDMYTLHGAQWSFKHVIDVHQKVGWFQI